MAITIKKPNFNAGKTAKGTTISEPLPIKKPNFNAGKTAKGTTMKKPLTGKAKEHSEINKRYDNYAKQYSNIETRKANAQIKANKAAMESNVRGASTQGAVSQRYLNQQLAHQGINGGASETSKLQMRNNTTNVQAGYRNNYASQKTSIQNSLRDNIATYKLTNNQNRQTALDSADNRRISKAQADREYKFKLKQYKDSRNDLKAQGYTSTDAVNKAIERAKKKGRYDLLPSLYSQRGALANANK